MRLELFTFIDKTIELLNEKQKSLYEELAALEKFFDDTFCTKDNFLMSRGRVKQANSLREKILRNNLYMQYESPKELIDNISDIIGVRLECRFIEDEEIIYKDLKNLFNCETENGFYKSHINEAISLKLDSKQPQIQKNGFEIYKIDGRYEKNGKITNFELQIKSLVNIFWGDIDHKVLYKNYNYVLTEDFFKDIMNGIKDNLTMVDKQLLSVYEHLNMTDSSNISNNKKQLMTLVSKSVHDIYKSKVKNELGYIVDYKSSCDMIAEYLFMKSNTEAMYDYTQSFIKILSRLSEIEDDNESLTEHLEFDRKIIFNDEFSKELGVTVLNLINKDFKWNLFFRIIFDIEEGTNADDFEGFIIFLRYKIYEAVQVAVQNKNMTDTEKSEIIDFYLDIIVQEFKDNLSLNYISGENIDAINKRISIELQNIESFEQFCEYKDELGSL